MRVSWTGKASSDLVRIDEVLRPKNSRAVARVIRALLSAPGLLLDSPRAGERIEGSGDVELRRLLVDDYEVQYEVRPDEIRIARVFHMREKR